MNVRLTQEKTVHIVAVQAASADLVTKFNFKSKYKWLTMSEVISRVTFAVHKYCETCPII